MKRMARIMVAALVPLVLGGCESIGDKEVSVLDRIGLGDPLAGKLEDYKPVSIPGKDSSEQASMPGKQDSKQDSKQDDGKGQSQVFRGTGKFVASGGGIGAKQSAGGTEPEGNITLNFENTDIREVVKVILGDMLQEGYILDPNVRGGVTMQTGRPLAREDLLPTLETLLRMNGAAVVKTGDIYRVLPATMAVKGVQIPQLADAATPIPAGYRVVVVPLKNISVTEMGKILGPLVMDGSIIRSDVERNLLVLAGSGGELQNVMQTINTFDVDWIKGLSVGFFRLENGSAKDVLTHLHSILGGEETLAGLVKITPIESANGLLVVTPRPEYLDQVEEWIGRLDGLGGSGSGSAERLHVYRVKNGLAEDLANLLNQLFQQNATSTTKTAEVAPGLTGTKISASAAGGKGAGAKKTAGNKGAIGASGSKAVSKAGSGGKAKVSVTSTVKGGGLEAEIRVVADAVHNTLLIMSTPADFRRIKDVLKDLDVVPLQVHVEATIVEVLLDGDLKYGLQWFFKDSVGKSKDYDHLGILDTGSSGLGGIQPGFNWSLIDSAEQVRAILSTFAGDSLVRVLSAPSVMVLDNHTASIQVGDEVPTVSSQQQSTGAPDAPIVNNIQYRDTGVLLTVTPRVNPGGLVTMEISQEVSDAVDSAAGPDQPIIQTRNIQSTVAVQGGQTVVLGGLIRNERSRSAQGVPGLYKAPLIGPLFGGTNKSATRTELVVVLTPTVIASEQDANAITEDFRKRLKGLEGAF